MNLLHTCRLKWVCSRPKLPLTHELTIGLKTLLV